MIDSFQHRGLKRLYERGDASGIRPDLLDKTRTILETYRCRPRAWTGSAFLGCCSMRSGRFEGYAASVMRIGGSRSASRAATPTMKAGRLSLSSEGRTRAMPMKNPPHRPLGPDQLSGAAESDRDEAAEARREQGRPLASSDEQAGASPEMAIRFEAGWSTADTWFGCRPHTIWRRRVEARTGSGWKGLRRSPRLRAGSVRVGALSPFAVTLGRRD